MSNTIRALLILGGIIVLIYAYFFIGKGKVSPNVRYGMTWSDPYAVSLGIDPVEGFNAALNDLNIKYFRIPTYWTETQPELSEFKFDRVKQQLDAVAAKGGKAIVVVGYKQPRWPECWMPDWARKLPADQRDRAQLNYVERTVRTFIDHPAVEAWQVENEPSFAFDFGICDPPLTKTITRKELTLVRDIEKTNGNKHPIYTTASGELSWWMAFGTQIDGVGISVYRVILHPLIGIFKYSFLQPWSYLRKANLVTWLVHKVYVSEFQMEPWSTMSLPDTLLEDQFKTFDKAQMDKNFIFAEQMGFREIYFWGAEWWYWMKTKHNHPEFWETAKTFFQAHP